MNNYKHFLSRNRGKPTTLCGIRINPNKRNQGIIFFVDWTHVDCPVCLSKRNKLIRNYEAEFLEEEKEQQRKQEEFKKHISKTDKGLCKFRSF